MTGVSVTPVGKYVRTCGSRLCRTGAGYIIQCLYYCSRSSSPLTSPLLIFGFFHPSACCRFFSIFTSTFFLLFSFSFRFSCSHTVGQSVTSIISYYHPPQCIILTFIKIFFTVYSSNLSTIVCLITKRQNFPVFIFWRVICLGSSPKRPCKISSNFFFAVLNTIIIMITLQINYLILY